MSHAARTGLQEFNHRMDGAGKSIRLIRIVDSADKPAGYEMSNVSGEPYYEIGSGATEEVAVLIADAFIAGMEWVKTTQVFAEEEGGASADT